MRLYGAGIEIKLDDAVDQLKIFKPHGGRERSGPLRRNQTVDAGAQIVKYKVLLGGGLAVVDFLRPLLKRQLDSESLVDREGDIEEVKAVNAEIIDGVALRLDRVAGDVACLGDDIGHRIKR
jgi:hypothetical protein